MINAKTGKSTNKVAFKVLHSQRTTVWLLRKNLNYWVFVFMITISAKLVRFELEMLELTSNFSSQVKDEKL